MTRAGAAMWAGMVLATGSSGVAVGDGIPKPVISEQVQREVIAKLVAINGPASEPRVRHGVTQVALRWWPEDGDGSAFADFCQASFISDPQALAATFARLEQVLEQIDGHLHEVRRELQTPTDLDTGPISQVDRLLAQVDLAAHVDEDLFKSKVAFVVLLNFPVHTLAERLAAGGGWDRETWARSRLTERFADRVPAEVLAGMSRALTAADAYIAGYNIRMDRLATQDGRLPFPEGLRLISHWGLRDELASHYGEGGGVEKQRMIARVMERIVWQQIPAIVIDNPAVVWCPQTNSVTPLVDAQTTAAPNPTREADVRYATWLANFRAFRAADPYTPTAPSTIARTFDQQRQIPEREVEALLVTVLTAPEVKRLASLISHRLGRPLEPFDIWYSGFGSRAGYSEASLDQIVSSRYPTVAAFQADLPAILTRLGFAADRAHWLADRIVVDPSRGAGHAMGAQRREDKAHLRTRVPPGGMNYKGFNIAVHELGHNVEQTFSLQDIDHWCLAGVPNTAFTEALAFSFQGRDLELLGLAGAAAARSNQALGTLWATYEIAGVSLVDMKAWQWLYAHPDASPAQLGEAVRQAAQEVWNAYFAPVFGERDQVILAIYSHMISYPLYLSDYAIGHIIAFEVAEKLRGGHFGAEFERVARQGRLTPDAWMRGAVGRAISAEPLLYAAREALAVAN